MLPRNLRHVSATRSLSRVTKTELAALAVVFQLFIRARGQQVRFWRQGRRETESRRVVTLHPQKPELRPFLSVFVRFT